MLKWDLMSPAEGRKLAWTCDLSILGPGVQHERRGKVRALGLRSGSRESGAEGSPA